MVKMLGTFDFEIDPNGACVTTTGQRLCSACLSDGEVDANINSLKKKLDAVGEKMKAAIKKQAKKPMTFN